jgi:serine/threonine-protein kinase RsbW
MRDTRVECLTVPASLEALSSLGTFVLAAAASAGLEERARYALRLAVHEIAANCITHGHPEPAGQSVLELRAEIQPDALTITLENTGPAYDPRQTPPPADLSQSLEDRSIGGLGVYLALHAVDAFDYERVGNTNRHRFLVKRRA